MKRILFVHGDKGGVGKTQAATRTAAAFLAVGRPLTLIDGDARNPGLHHLFHTVATPVQCCNVLKAAGFDAMIAAIAEAEGDVLIDMPAGGSAATRAFKDAGSAEGTINLAEVLAEISARAVVLFAIDQNREPIVALRDELKVFPEGLTDWIVVRNHFQDRPFTEFDSSQTRAALLDRGGRIIDMGRLDPAVTSLMARDRLNLVSIQSSAAASVIAKIRARAALREWTEQLRTVEVLDG